MVIDPTYLGAITELFQALCLSIVILSPTRNTCLFADGYTASLSVQPVYGMTAVWVSFKSVFVFPDSCVYWQSASSVCVSLRQQWPSHQAVQQVQVVSQKENANSCVFIKWTVTGISHLDTTDILILKMLNLKGSMKQNMLPSKSMRSAAVTQVFVPAGSM